MSRSPIAALPLALALAACAAPPGAEVPDLNQRRHEGSVRFGTAHLDDDLRPFDRARTGALEYSYGLPRSPWRFFAGLSQTSDEAFPEQTFTRRDGMATADFPVAFRADLSELYAGVRHEWSMADGRLYPYLGGGLSLVHGSFETAPGVQRDPTGNPNLDFLPPARIDDNDESLGLFTQAGIAVPLGSSFRLSADWRWLFLAELDVQGSEADVGYQLLAISLGFRF